MKEDSFVGDILRFVISVIIIFLFLAFIGLMWKLKNGDSYQLEKSTEMEGYEVIRFTKSCIDGKQFINARRGITINLDMEGKPIACKVKE